MISYLNDWKKLFWIFKQQIYKYFFINYQQHSCSDKVLMTGSPLTTHVLDTARGIPARNVQIQLYFEELRPDSRMWKHIASGWGELIYFFTFVWLQPVSMKYQCCHSQSWSWRQDSFSSASRSSALWLLGLDLGNHKHFCCGIFMHYKFSW